MRTQWLPLAALLATSSVLAQTPRPAGQPRAAPGTPQAPGVYAETPTGLVKMSYCLVEDTLAEDTADSDSRVFTTLASPPRPVAGISGFLVNMPQATISGTELYWADPFDLRRHPWNHPGSPEYRFKSGDISGGQRLGADIVSVGTGVYRVARKIHGTTIADERAGSGDGGAFILVIQMPEGTPDRAYAILSAARPGRRVGRYDFNGAGRSAACP